MFLLFFLLIILFPWAIKNNDSLLPSIFIEENSVGYYQTNTCEFTLFETFNKNINNKNIEVLVDQNSSVKCFGKINGVDFISNTSKVYVGTNLNVDFLLQSLTILFLISKIPKTNKLTKNNNSYIGIVIISSLLFLHLKGEKLYYEYFVKNFNLTLESSNYFIFSILLTCIFILTIFNDLLRDRFYNFINYLPFLFLFVGTFNTLNVNIFVILISFIGVKAHLEKKVNKLFLIIYLTFSIIQILNFNESNLLFDVDKLKGFINSSQTINSLIYWIIIFYLLITGILYLINESAESFNLEIFIRNFLVTGSLLTIVGYLGAINSYINFFSYYYLGLNKYGIKNLESVSGNTWRGIGSSAEALGEIYGFILLITVLSLFSRKISLTKTMYVYLAIITFGLYKTNNFAVLVTLILLMFFYILITRGLINKVSFSILLILSLISSNIYMSTISYDLYSRALLREAYFASELSIELPKDQNNNSAIENLNFGEILKYPRDKSNISNSLYFFTDKYTNGKNINNIPNFVAAASFIAKTINRSEKWGIFIAKYNPDKIEFLFGHGPQQISKYYLNHQTKVNTGLVLPHSSFLDLLIFYGLLGLILATLFIIRLLFVHKDNYFYLTLCLYFTINYLKSDSILYIGSFIIFLFSLNLYKFKTNN